MTDFLTALALAIALEGAAYALFPDTMRRTLVRVLAMPPAALRVAGLVACALGVAGVALIRA